jgi:hypothetical protein
MYLPFAMALFDMVVGGNIVGTLMGIVVGHLYYFLKEIYGRQQNTRVARFFEAPKILQRLVRQPGYAPGSSVSSAAGFTMYTPKNPMKKGTSEENVAPQFKPFTGSGKKLGAD